MFFGSNLPVSVLLVQVKRHIINLIVVAFPHKSIIKCRAQSLSLSMSWHLAVFLSPLWWTGSLPLYKIAFWYLAIRDGLGVHMHPKSWHCKNWVESSSAALTFVGHPVKSSVVILTHQSPGWPCQGHINQVGSIPWVSNTHMASVASYDRNKFQVIWSRFSKWII